VGQQGLEPTLGADAWLKEKSGLVGAAGGLRAAGAVSCFFAPTGLDAGMPLNTTKKQELINGHQTHGHRHRLG